MMKKYIKQLALSVLTLCMIFTLASGNVANAAVNVTPGSDVSISYIGSNLNPRNFSTSAIPQNAKLLGKDENGNDIKSVRIDPTSNVSGYDLSKNLNGLYYGNQQTDNFGNEFYQLKTEQVYKGKIYKLVGWKEVTSYYDSSTDAYLADGFYYEDESIAKQNVDFEYNEEGIYIGLDDWNKINTNKRNPKFMTLGAVYTSKQMETNKGTYDYETDKTKWKANKIDLGETSNGIDIVAEFAEDENDVDEIIYTIPSDYKEDEIQITANDELVKLLIMRYGISDSKLEENEKGELVVDVGDIKNKPGIDKEQNIKNYNKTQPGKVLPFNIRIVNDSKYEYGYKNNSLKIMTSNLKNRYTGSENNNFTTTLPGLKGFDGQQLLDKFTPKRTLNKALLSLVGEDNAINKIADEKYLSDRLIEKGYTGIEQLNRYYIDFYNFELGTQHTKLEDFGSDLAIVFGSRDDAGNSVNETNVEIAETMYNYFYNEILAVYPNYNKTVKGEKPKNYATVSIGKTMKNGNDDMNIFMSEELASIKKDENGIAHWSMSTDGLFEYSNGVNIFNNMDYSFDMGFKLEKKVGDVIVDKHIELGGFDKNNTPTFMFKLTDVNGNTYFKTISFNEGETDKQVVFKDIPYGKYTVEEIDPIRYEVLGQPVLEGVLDDVKQSGYVQYVNTKVKDNDFSDTNLVINSFKKGDNSIEISKKEHNNGKRG